MAKERSELVTRQQAELREFDGKLREKQRVIERLENGGAVDDPVSSGPREDALDRVPEARLAVLPDFVEEAPAAQGEFGEQLDSNDWRRRAVRLAGLVEGICHMVQADPQPKLVVAIVRLAADLNGAHSMRQVADAYKLSPERISQRVEEVQKRFNLPKNRHNKSEAAVIAYRVNRCVHINKTEVA